MPSGMMSEEQAKRVTAVVEAFTTTVNAEAERLLRVFGEWHRRTFEPFAKAYMRRRLVAVLRAELARRTRRTR